MKKIIILALISYTLQIDHCIKEIKICDSCKSGFNFQYNSGIYCTKIAISFCEKMNGDKCQTCQTGYELNSDQTECNKIHTIENCDIEYIDEEEKHVCQSCIKDYFTYQNGKGCYKNENCKYNNMFIPFICITCHNYFYLNSNYLCDKSYCSRRGIDKKCRSCYEQFYLNENSICKKIPIPYCAKGSENVCIECLKDYALSDDGASCTPKEIPIDDHCYEYYDERAGLCSTCKTGYTANSQGLCEDNCANYKVTGCDLCEDGYITYDKIKCELIKEDNKLEIIGNNLCLMILSLFFVI